MNKNIFERFPQWQSALTGHHSFSDLGSYMEAAQLETVMAQGQRVVYHETAKGVIFTTWLQPRCS